MERYLLISSDGILSEVIAAEDPVFPGIPITERYTAEFLKQCVVRTDEQIEAEGIEPGMSYNWDEDKFFVPPPPPPPDPSEIPPEPETPEAPMPEGNQTQAEAITALQEENKLLKAQVSMLETQQTFLEDCLLEMADEVYA